MLLIFKDTKPSATINNNKFRQQDYIQGTEIEKGQTVVNNGDSEIPNR